MKLPQIFLACALPFLLSACTSHDILPATTVASASNTIGINPNVFLGGAIGSSAVLWRNGIADTLDRGSIRSLFIDGADVYAAGWKYVDKSIDNNSLQIPVATYWKNGVPVVLSDTSQNSYVQSIFVANNHVYAVGHQESTAYRPDIPFVAKCWKDGTPITLSTGGAIISDANAIYVSGTDVYVAGLTLHSGKRFVATYWKNGEPVYLTDGTQDCVAASIFVVGSDVYVAGTVGFQDLSIESSFLIGQQAKVTATYWKNGKAVSLSNEGSYASSIFVNGTGVYVAGTIGSASAAVGTLPDQANVATYWKNGVQVNLNNDNQYSLATSISVTQNGDVYLAGTIDFRAVCWVNGARTYLADNPRGDKPSSLYSITLTN